MVDRLDMVPLIYIFILSRIHLKVIFILISTTGEILVENLIY